MNIRVLSIKPTWLSARLVSSFTVLLRYVLPVSMVLQWFYLSEMGLDLQSTLGAFELSILAPISLSGILCRLSGVKVSMFRNEYEKPDNFMWGNFWPGEGSGTRPNGLYLLQSLLPVFSTDNFFTVFHWVRERQYCTFGSCRSHQTCCSSSRTLCCSGPVAYVCINVSYFVVVSKKDILKIP